MIGEVCIEITSFLRILAELLLVHVCCNCSKEYLSNNLSFASFRSLTNLSLSTLSSQKMQLLANNSEKAATTL